MHAYMYTYVRAVQVAHRHLVIRGQNRLDWTGLDWTGLDWAGLGWTGLDWAGLDPRRPLTLTPTAIMPSPPLMAPTSNLTLTQS